MGLIRLVSRSLEKYLKDSFSKSLTRCPIDNTFVNWYCGKDTSIIDNKRVGT